MIDYLLVVLLFAFVPIGIILMFIGCFYCFLFIQHCATYHEEDEEEANSNSNDSHNTRRGEGRSTPSIVVTVQNCDSTFDGGGGSINNIGGGVRPERRRGVSLSPALIPGRHKRLERDDEFIGSNSNSGINFNNDIATNNTTCSEEEQPPPPYHSICFAKNSDENIQVDNSRDEDDDSLFRISTV